MPPEAPEKAASSSAEGVHANGENGDIELNPIVNGSVSDERSRQLQPKLTLINGCTVIIGSIIGSGIFISPKAVSASCGSVGLSLLVWLFGGIYSLIGAYCFAELGTFIMRFGADYAYIYECFGPFLAFMRLWVECMIIRPGTIAIVALAFAKYITEPVFYGCDQPEMAVQLLAACCILLLGAINCISVRLSTRVQDIFTYAKCFALFAIIVTGIVHICMGNVSHFEAPFEGSNWNPLGLSSAVYASLFAYNGWNYLNVVVEELQNPKRNLPLAISLSVSICTVVYVLANIAYFAVVPPEIVNTSAAVGVLFAQKMYGSIWWLMPIFVGLSTFGTVNGTLFTGTRLFFVGGREKQIPVVLNMIQRDRNTPVPAVLTLSFMSLIYLMMSSQIYVMINYVGFVTWLSIAASVLALLVFRKTRADQPRLIKVWLGWPIIYLIMTAWLIIASIFESPTETGWGVVLMLTAVPVYLVGVVWTKRPRFIDAVLESITIFAQKMFIVLPEVKTE